MNDTTVQEIEMSMEEAQAKIRRADALDRLYKNTDFQEIIGRGYFEQEAIRLVHLKGDPHVQDEKIQNAIVRDMDGIGALKAYFSVIYMRAREAQMAIEDAEAELESIRQEDAE